MKRDKEKKKEYDRAYREKNRARVSEYMRKWRAENAESLKDKKREYYLSTRPPLKGRPLSYTINQVRDAVASSVSVSETLSKLSLSRNGANANTIKKILKLHSISTTHFLSRSELFGRHLKGKVKIKDEHVFKIDSKVCPNTLVARFKMRSSDPYLCKLCGQGSTHNGQPLVLQLDHKNGICNDNRMENLRWLCPNCHTQTPTYSRKNAGRVPECIAEKRRQSRVRRPR